ncbi:TIGR04500 family putative peptide maturation system protein [Actinomadura parmotrematis]|uniref:TIGR04500 family putative peptide maturation system protein n=1 Tax=Actinomadura parmotrematis TaxID=2864039 RepID=A0ABS7FNB4_9ACTN|nr:TIGR04500 family putative peptide maturation system protein [Actinomadura parmotrematis]MBW8481874.1 TIGR04500 family putative peptide maturation system protein [Actinomadura parmotrematis]
MITETGLGAALGSAAELLRGLPRRRDGESAARAAVRAWAADHPGLDAELVIAPHPSSPVVDYDLVLAHPDGGTVTVTAQPEDGVPWLVDHSTHWAANRVLTVDGFDVTVPQALMAVRAAGARRPSLHRELVDHCLLYALAAGDTAPVTREETQAAADEFRRSRGLHDRAVTLAWLAEAGLTEDDLARHVDRYARVRRLRRRKERELGPALLAADPGRFDRVDALWALTDGEVTAARVARTLPVVPTVRMELTSVETVADALPEPMRGAAADERVGPVPYEGRWLAGLVRSRRPAAADVAARAAERAAFDAWLAERRAAADIRWHWL